MNNQLELTDLKKIIQDLISFIVIDGKTYVDDRYQKEYITSYIRLFIKAFNPENTAINAAYTEEISKDILKIFDDI
ncbi:hypothetical protein [Aquimarina rhabdastrellae]